MRWRSGTDATVGAGVLEGVGGGWLAPPEAPDEPAGAVALGTQASSSSPPAPRAAA
jgi:hypothetical protein